MQKYRYTQHVLGHIALPELDSAGKPVMILPDPADVQAAIAANAQHEAAARKALQGTPNADKARIAPLVPVPVVKVKVKQDVVMYYDTVVELPEDNADVLHYVELGYLTPLPAEARLMDTKPPAADKKEIAPAQGASAASGVPNVLKEIKANPAEGGTALG